MTQPSLFITGVAGFIGRNVAEEALRRGYRVTGVDRNSAALAGVELVRADIRDTERITAAMRGHDQVIHLAAITSNVEFIRNAAECYDINVNGFLSVIESALRSGCRRFVYASSAAVYLENFGETVTIDVATQRNHYAKTKIMNEMVADSYRDIHGLSTLGLRYFNVYGQRENDKGDYASIVSLFLKAAKNREPLRVYGDGRQARDLINVSDAAQVTLDLLERGTYPVYNVGTGVATAYGDIAAMIDRTNIIYVANPLPHYQYYTRAETSRLRETIGSYKFIELENGIRDLTI